MSHCISYSLLLFLQVLAHRKLYCHFHSLLGKILFPIKFLHPSWIFRHNLSPRKFLTYGGTTIQPAHKLVRRVRTFCKDNKQTRVTETLPRHGGKFYSNFPANFWEFHNNCWPNRRILRTVRPKIFAIKTKLFFPFIDYLFNTLVHSSPRLPLYSKERWVWL